jgi:excisionase family DNA binding protein
MNSAHEMKLTVERLAFSIREVCQAIPVSVDSLHRAAKAGLLRTIRVGGRVLVPADELRRIAREGLQVRRGRPPKREKAI